MWIHDKDGRTVPDSYRAFRGSFRLEAPAKAELRLAGASSFLVWLDGALLTEGPSRWPKHAPEYDHLEVDLAAGEHLLAACVHHDGVTTRIMPDVPPFFHCELHAAAAAGREPAPAPIAWRAAPLAGFRPGVRRVGACLGWAEFRNTAADPDGWQLPGFDDSGWAEPDPALNAPAGLARCAIDPVRHVPGPMALLAEGPAADLYGYENDDPPVRFFLRDLECDDKPARGVWRRYDVGYVRAGRACFTIEAPAGAVVEVAYSETLAHGRVMPWISLMTSASCAMDRYVARGGRQAFMPMEARGGRYVEVHVMAPPEKVRFVSAEHLWRTGKGEPEGRFACSDPLLSAIWEAGAQTFRSCTEDAITDCPVRERGQWTGDTVNVGIALESTLYRDVGLARRCLAQAAQCAAPSGLVPALFPGSGASISTYALCWTYACVNYAAIAGDEAFLRALYPAAEANIEFFLARTGPAGIGREAGSGFIDWGYVPDASGLDVAALIFLIKALDAMADWAGRCAGPEKAARYRDARATVAAQVSDYLDRTARKGDWAAAGYHVAVLALGEGFFDADPGVKAACVAYIKEHMLSCFPNDPSAPRLADPSVRDRRLITPYFAHFAFPALIRAGETEFVHEQMRVCWGWMLAQGDTTILEVFDARWSHCHEWAASPTWILSRFGLGLHVAPPEDGLPAFRFDLRPGRLKWASGALPVSTGGTARVSWKRRGRRIAWKVETDSPFTLLRGDEKIRVSGTFAAELLI